MARRFTKTKRTRVDPVVKLAKAIGVPDEQIIGGRFKAHDVVNHSADDHRAMVRALGAQMLNPDARETVCRLTRVELLVRDGTITKEQQAACEWYGAMNELAFAYGQGTTANYGGVGGAGGIGWDHGARSIGQAEARANVIYARGAIPEHLLLLFDKVVLGPLDIRTMTKADRLGFSLAAFKLHEQVGHLLAIAA